MKSILSQWKNKKKEKNTSNGILEAPEGALIPLSHGQQQLWFLQKLYPDNPFYNYSEAYILNGDLNRENLELAVQQLIIDHDILRSRYIDNNGEPIQKIDARLKPSIEFYDFSNFSNQTRETELAILSLKDVTTKFSLEKGPLLKFSLVKCSKDEHRFFATFNHIIIDNWSMMVFRNQIAVHYKRLSEGLPLVSLKTKIQYTDYTYYQRESTVENKQLDYWKNKFKEEAPVLNLPLDYERPVKPSFKGAMNTEYYSRELSQSILILAKKMETTPYVLTLTAYYILLYKCSKQQDVSIGTPITNRNHKELEELIGFFIDTIVLRTEVLSEMSFSELFSEVRKTTLDAFANKDVSFDLLVKMLKPKRALNLNPLFQVMFVYNKIPDKPIFGDNLKIEDATLEVGVSKFDLTLHVTEDENGLLSSTIEYATDLFKESTINKFQSQLKLVFDSIVKNQEVKISEISIEKHILEENKKTSNNKLKTLVDTYNGIHSIIEEIAKNNPDKIVVTFKNTSITYNELDKKATLVAKSLIRKTKGENQIIGLCLDRSVEMIIGLLGILKAGCAYLPIDTEYPEERIQYMVVDANVNYVLTENEHISLFKSSNSETMLLEDSIEHTPNVTLPIVKNEQLAYVIYTSGSTGKPKGVPITHQNIITSTLGRFDFYNHQPSAFLLLSSIAFDSSKAGLFWTLCTGGTLIIGEKHIEQDMNKLGNIIQENAITHTLMLPSLYNLCLEHCAISNLNSLKTVIVAGEACSAVLVKNHFDTLPSIDLYNEYGPTEATVWCIAHQIKEEDSAGTIPIGKPVANATIYLLNDELDICPFGTKGEIYIGGDGLSGTYINRPDLTKEAYISNPFSSERNSVLYKTGDFGRYRQDGCIEFLGRIDQQIKIRGFRVELEEIQKAIIAHPMVDTAIVLVEESNDLKRLNAYVICNRENLDIIRVKRYLKSHIPDYMIPSTFIKIESIPTLPNGKLDNKALAALNKNSKKERSNNFKEPNSFIEEQLVGIWKEVLNIKDISISDNFFEIGGDSILSIQIISKARKLGMVLSPNQLFDHQTIAELSLFVTNEINTKDQQGIVLGEVPLSPIQKWFFNTQKNVVHHWNQGVRINNINEDRSDVIEKLVKNAIQKHDALRLSFSKKNEKWKAKVLHPEAINAFMYLDYTNANNLEDDITIFLKNLQENFILREGNLFRTIYIKTNQQVGDICVFLAHHLIIDVVSWQILLNSFISQKDFSIEDSSLKTTSIKDWTTYLENIELEEKEVVFWKKQTESTHSMRLDGKAYFPITEGRVGIIKSKLNKEATEGLSKWANEAYNTKIDELLVTALVDALCVLSDTNNISISMEKHGRETLGTNFDFSNTVGWFTSFFPLTFVIDSKDISGKIIEIKEQLRQIPRAGIGYGVLKYLKGEFNNIEEPSVVFNYLGKQDNNRDVTPILDGLYHIDSERYSALDINAHIKENQIHLKWSYGKDVLKKETIDILIREFNSKIDEILMHCKNVKESKYTPSDFPDVELNQDDLDNLLSNL